MVAELPSITFPDKLIGVRHDVELVRRKLRPKSVSRILVAVMCVLCFEGLLQPGRRALISFRTFLLAGDKSAEWSQYAYCQYVTTEDYLCNSLMIFESLARLQSQADRLMMYPKQWSTDKDSTTGQLLLKARDRYNVKLQPISVLTGKGEVTWAQSFTKLLAFNQTQYKRVLSLDSDSTVLQNMDYLFHLPPAVLAAPRAYWLAQTSQITLASTLLLIQPSEVEFHRILEAFNARLSSEFDMDIVGHLYSNSAMVLPHRSHALLTGEFREELNHSAYLGSNEAIWDPDVVIDEAKYVHFSDFPRLKPWIQADEKQLRETTPKCRLRRTGDDEQEDCRDREIWLGLYADFQRRRKEVCGLDVIAGDVGSWEVGRSQNFTRRASTFRALSRGPFSRHSSGSL